MSLSVEIYDVLSSFWRPDVFLHPLTHRFIRGAVQIIGRTVNFVGDGLHGKLQFGEEKKKPMPSKESSEVAGNGEFTLEALDEPPSSASRDPYYYLIDVAAVAWEMNILESNLTDEFIDATCKAAVGNETETVKRKGISGLVRSVMLDVSIQIGPLIKKAWNEVIVNILISKCCGPLAAIRTLPHHTVWPTVHHLHSLRHLFRPF